VLCSRFDWPSLPVPRRRPEILWWKLEAIQREHPSGEPFVWVDDELDERCRSSDGVLDTLLALLDVPFLLVCPNAHVGLQARDIERIENFVAVG
jgi:hypothetical protein